MLRRVVLRSMSKPMLVRSYAGTPIVIQKDFIPEVRIEHEMGSTENYGADMSLLKNKAPKETKTESKTDFDSKLMSMDQNLTSL